MSVKCSSVNYQLVWYLYNKLRGQLLIGSMQEDKIGPVRLVRIDLSGEIYMYNVHLLRPCVQHKPIIEALDVFSAQ